MKMLRKLFVMMLIVAAGLSATACWEGLLYDYVCSGAGTCDDPRYCVYIDYYDGIWDAYYQADGEKFYCDSYYEDCSYAWDDLYDWCWY